MSGLRQKHDFLSSFPSIGRVVDLSAVARRAKAEGRGGFGQHALDKRQMKGFGSEAWLLSSNFQPANDLTLPGAEIESFPCRVCRHGFG